MFLSEENAELKEKVRRLEVIVGNLTRAMCYDGGEVGSEIKGVKGEKGMVS